MLRKEREKKMFSSFATRWRIKGNYDPGCDDTPELLLPPPPSGKEGEGGGRVREVSEREKRKCVRVCMCVCANEIECVCVCVCAGGGFKATCRVHRLAASFDVDAGTAPLPHPPPHTLHFFHISLSRSLYYKVVLRSC